MNDSHYNECNAANSQGLLYRYRIMLLKIDQSVPHKLAPTVHHDFNYSPSTA